MDLSFDWGGGGQVSTMDDLCLFLKGLMSGALFKTSATLASMHEWITPPGLAAPRTGVGLGFFRTSFDGLELWGHSGAWGAKMAYAPAHDLYFAGTLNSTAAPADWHAGLIRQCLV